MSPEQQRGEISADRLLDAALRVHAAEGERSVTARPVTTAGGVGPGSLHHRRALSP
ncbi:hypothetical protein ACIBBD_36865 [Streptomyces sp. NPDC051315]|uniref:hypothetical protein n=1 Tax=Streptomyces sp. NPDC051315 TaxID=3365650 RepID=UPI00378B3AE6